jgi:hypothetical protein
VRRLGFRREDRKQELKIRNWKQAALFSDTNLGVSAIVWLTADFG